MTEGSRETRSAKAKRGDPSPPSNHETQLKRQRVQPVAKKQPDQFQEGVDLVDQKQTQKPPKSRASPATPITKSERKTPTKKVKAQPRSKAVASPKGKNAAPAEEGWPPTVSGLWLIKSEPDEYSLDDLKNEENSIGFWDGVRNLQARNLLQKMKLGDQCFFYHSSCKVPGIVGIAEVVEEATPDLSAFDETSKNFDPKSDKDKPRWFGVRVQYKRELKRKITLEELKKFKEGALAKLTLLRVPRLSVQIVSKTDWQFVLSKEEEDVA